LLQLLIAPYGALITASGLSSSRKKRHNIKTKNLYKD